MQSSGATRAEIESHYDRGDAFYALWLGAERVYSCATWDRGISTLEEAQARKLTFHLQNLRLPARAALLDVGCGWGGLMRRARRDFGVERACGLTLSESQSRSINEAGDPCLTARLESWTGHEPERFYDGIACIGAFEHFTRPENTAGERLAIYREFFGRCRGWLAPGARLSLQTIAYG